MTRKIPSFYTPGLILSPGTGLHLDAWDSPDEFESYDFRFLLTIYMRKKNHEVGLATFPGVPVYPFTSVIYVRY